MFLRHLGDFLFFFQQNTVGSGYRQHGEKLTIYQLCILQCIYIKSVVHPLTKDLHSYTQIYFTVYVRYIFEMSIQY